MGQKTYRLLEENAPRWRKQVNGALSTICDIIEAGYEQLKSEQKKQQRVFHASRSLEKAGLMYRQSNEEKDRLSQCEL